MSTPKFTQQASDLIHHAIEEAESRRHEFVMPEHLLLALLAEDRFRDAVEEFSPAEDLRVEVEDFLDKTDNVPEDFEIEGAEFSSQLNIMLNQSLHSAEFNGGKDVDVPHMVNGFFYLEDSWATYLLKEAIDGDVGDFMRLLIDGFTPDDAVDIEPEEVYGEEISGRKASGGKKKEKEDWKKLVTCMNSCHQNRNPLIGREGELQRTIQVLCRKDKNNPLHVGDPGVGKTALVWGLVRMIEEGRVPERLRGSKVYMMDLSSIVAGTQYRGDFEKRIKQVMEGIRDEGDNNIVYIDEIHTLVGAGATGESSLDASNILKPYLEEGSIRFIGSTTYEEYNRYFSRSKGMIRRFQQIDIDQPSVEEAKNILRQLQPHYEEFHNVRYSDEGIDYAVEASARHITDRFLPDKAIDLVDEAGAAMECMEGNGDSPDAGNVDGGKKEVGVKEMADVLAKMCKVESLAVAEKDDFTRLENLDDRMTALIYGQDAAIRQVVESVQMSRAGLLEDNKPLASLLFVGPTGVGKTEVARVLSKELGVELIRFDMSEYVEKHSVAKLIGSPAGYVGYEDGGLLTDAIRKSPNCVLLLDEIEKAHQDIYNILLQVMDYARLTDNKGRQADFRNVILIMTSNAGAQFASSSVGFASNVSKGSAMMKQVKRTFKPEFLNRLSGTVVFNDMDRDMATLILKKKLGELGRKLEAKNVSLDLSPDAFDYLLAEGFTPEYGAREMDRVIRQQLSPLLMREILFGSLRDGGKATVSLKDNSLSLIAPDLLPSPAGDSIP